MSLSAALNIGRSAINASSLGIQVTGNNMANAATPGYSRQRGVLTPLGGDGTALGTSIGSGVRLQAIQRQVDEALQSRLRAGTSDAAAANTLRDIYSQVENVLGELNDSDLSSELSSFFKVWSERANQTKSSASVVQQGEKLAQFVRRVRSDLADQRTQIDAQLDGGITRANELLTTIAGLNKQIQDSELAGTPANTLRDQRDHAAETLSQLMEVSVVDRGRQGVDVLVGSTPVVLGSRSRGVELRRESVDGRVAVSVHVIEDGQDLDIRSGQMGSLLASRDQAVDGTIRQLDSITSQLIFEVNRQHATGVPQNWLARTTSTLNVPAADRARAMNDAGNETFAALPFKPVNGGFIVNVRDKATQAVTSVRINVDLDGITAAGTPGTTDDTTPHQLAEALGAVPGLSASIAPNGQLQVASQPGYEFTFESDTSGVLGTLGLNAYFTGVDASDIGVRSDLASDPARLSAGKMVNGQLVENGTALSLAGLLTTGISNLSGRSLPDAWRDTAQEVGSRSSGAAAASDAANVVRDSLDAQRAAVSGVSIDEESISLLDYQRQYQAAARVISVAQEMTNTLIQLI
jgi:flagellar hook-associated protein 1 FlgK